MRSEEVFYAGSGSVRSYGCSILAPGIFISQNGTIVGRGIENEALQ